MYLYVCVPPKALAHTYKYGTAKETEQMFKYARCPQPKIFFYREDGKPFSKKNKAASYFAPPKTDRFAK
jgi:hypothetical protein